MPESASREKRKVFPRQMGKPSVERQFSRLQPVFTVLKESFEKKNVQFQNTPVGIEPEYALVFEVVNSVQNFYTAVKNAEGLEWLFDSELLNIDSDDDFYVIKDSKKTEDNFSGKIYCVMSNQQALEQMLSCWERYSNGETDVFAHGLAGLRDIFVNIKNIRTWNVNDRLDENQILDYWRETLEINGNSPIPFEIELFYRNDPVRRKAAVSIIGKEINKLHGRIIQESVIDAIAYHALLVELPRNQIEVLLEKYQDIELMQVDDIMFFRPMCQSMFQISTDTEKFEQINLDDDVTAGKEPVVALFDGMPIQNHPMLRDRIIVDDPDGIEIGYESRYRFHGTAMASLILNGDLNKPEPLKHKIYVRPIFRPKEIGIDRYQEMVPENCMIVDKIHAAVVRIFERTKENVPIAPSVKVINLSLGDPTRQLAMTMSPLARLLDYLSYKYSVLFVVSAGNHSEVLGLVEENFSDIQKMCISERNKLFFKKVIENQRNMKVLSPAENMNGLTIGAIYDDFCDVADNDKMVLAVEQGFPSPASAFGKGYRSIITPDLFYRGGRKYIYEDIYKRNVWQLSNREPGCKVAAPYAASTEHGQAYTFGTSDAAALISHEALKCYDILNDIYMQETQTPADSEFVAILLKAMLTHGASWDSLNVGLANVTGGKPTRLARWIGNGVPDIKRVEECAKNRVTLIGTGRLKEDEGHVYELPLPTDISSKTIKRRLTVTLAYFSPIEANKQAYRTAKLWFNITGSEKLTPDRANGEWQMVQKGTLQHEIFTGQNAIVWKDDDKISIKVNCKKDAGKIKGSIPYCIFVTFEIAEGYGIDIYSKVVNKVKNVIRP